MVMKYWDDGAVNSTRLRNVNYAWPKLKELSEYLSLNGIVCTSKLFDFSPKKNISDSEHIPYPLGEYKKAEKTNIILKKNEEFDFLFMFDTDTFFLKKDFPSILKIFENIKDREIYTFDLAKLEDKNLESLLEKDELDLEKVEWSYAYSGNKNNGPLSNGCIGGLGGVYICDIKLIIENGGFDEKFVGWGGEDGDMLGRIMISSNPYSIHPQRNFAPFHLPHFVDWNNINYTKRF